MAASTRYYAVLRVTEPTTVSVPHARELPALEGCSTFSSTDSSSPAFGGAGRSAPRLLFVLEDVEQPSRTRSFRARGMLAVDGSMTRSTA